MSVYLVFSLGDYLSMKIFTRPNRNWIWVKIIEFCNSWASVRLYYYKKKLYLEIAKLYTYTLIVDTHCELCIQNRFWKTFYGLDIQLVDFFMVRIFFSCQVWLLGKDLDQFNLCCLTHIVNNQRPLYDCYIVSAAGSSREKTHREIFGHCKCFY